MLVGLSIYDDTTVEDPRVFVEFPAQVVVSFASVLGTAYLAIEKGCASRAKVVMKGMSQADSFILEKRPAAVKATDVVGDISCEKSVFSSLGFLFESFAVIGECWLFVRVSLKADDKAQDELRHEKKFSFGGGHNWVSRDTQGGIFLSQGS